jgi:hypothetical protein
VVVYFVNIGEPAICPLSETLALVRHTERIPASAISFIPQAHSKNAVYQYWTCSCKGQL